MTYICKKYIFCLITSHSQDKADVMMEKLELKKCQNVKSDFCTQVAFFCYQIYIYSTIRTTTFYLR